MDRRQQKTRKAVFTAFEELISQKRYEDITVQEIIDLADIGRTTFYAHFETKDSVLDALCEDLFRHIFVEELSGEKTHDFSMLDHSENHLLTHILYHLKEDKERYKKLFAGQSAEIFFARFKLLFGEKLEEEIRAGRWKTKTSLPVELYMKLYISSFVEIVKWWFAHSCRESPEEIVRYFEEFCSTGEKGGDLKKRPGEKKVLSSAASSNCPAR